jgi:hypothetical protein
MKYIVYESYINATGCINTILTELTDMKRLFSTARAFLNPHKGITLHKNNVTSTLVCRYVQLVHLLMLWLAKRTSAILYTL